MNDDFTPGYPGAETPAAAPREDHTLGASTIFKLCAEVIQLREMNNRQHKMFESSLANTARRTQKEFQPTRRRIAQGVPAAQARNGRRKEVQHGLADVVAGNPSGFAAHHGTEAETGGAGSRARLDGSGRGRELRKVEAAVRQKNIVEYEGRPGEAYNPALHKRVGSERVEGMGPLLVARTVKKGYASQQPDFVLQRPEVIVTE